MRYKLYLLILAVCGLKSFAGTCTAIASTNFTLASTWSCGRVPTGYDQIIIPTGYTVTINTAIDLTTGGPPAPTNTMLSISGALFFSGNASRLEMVSSAAIVIAPGGNVTTDQNNSSQKIDLGGGQSEWNSGQGNLTGPLIITNAGLPIELTEFYGTCVTNGIELNWSTATEKNNDYFLIEKSINGMEWQPVGKIPGNGTTGVTHHYNHTEYNINSSDLFYYQLSQIDEDQTKTVFRAIDVNCSNNVPDKMILISNPASTELSILLSVKDISANNTIRIMNNMGEIVMETNINLNKGSNTFIFPLELSTGIYHILFSSDKTFLPSQKLLIIK
ncbi:MAG: hypothetical protein V4565_13735 [Bacteroidota bacterium]